MADASPELYDYVETAQMLRIGRSTLHKLVANGDLRPVKIGRRRLVTRSELDRFIASRMAR